MIGVLTRLARIEQREGPETTFRDSCQLFKDSLSSLLVSQKAHQLIANVISPIAKRSQAEALRTPSSTNPPEIPPVKVSHLQIAALQRRSSCWPHEAKPNQAFDPR